MATGFKNSTKACYARGGHVTDFGQNAQIARAAKVMKGAHGATTKVPGKKAMVGKGFNAKPLVGC